MGQYGAKIAIEYINGLIINKKLTLLTVNQEIFKKAEKVFIKFSEHKISFTDATTYVLYKEFGIDEIFTLDSDFKKIHVSTSF